MSCARHTKQGTECGRPVVSGTDYCQIHTPKKECSICASKRRLFKRCPECKFVDCTVCYKKLSRCPQCRYVYNEELDRRNIREIQEGLSEDFIRDDEITYMREEEEILMWEFLLNISSIR
jgi:hypothetical protein